MSVAGVPEIPTSSHGLQRKFSNEKHRDIAQGIAAREALFEAFPHCANSAEVVSLSAKDEEKWSKQAADCMHKAMKVSLNLRSLLDEVGWLCWCL